MIKKFGGYLAAIALAVGGTTVVTASPALAAGRCDQVNQTVGACFDYSGGSSARADFYFNRTPDNSYYTYSVWMQINGGNWILKEYRKRLTTSGRHCCWYQHVDGYPNRWQTGRTRVTIYTRSGAPHTTSDSPLVSFYA